MAFGDRRRQPGPVVHDGEPEPAALDAGDDGDRPALLARRDGVLHRVLDERLQQQRGHERGFRPLVDVELEPQAVAEAQLLDAEVEIQRVELLAQRHFLHRVLVERVAQELGQPRDGEVGGAVLAVKHERRYRVQRVEEEMRVQLVAQHLELRLLRERGLLERRLALELQALVELDAVVKAGPAQQQRHRGERADEDLERLRRVLDAPIRA